jgi:hypothetical protein
MLIDKENFALLIRFEEDELEKYSAQILLNAFKVYADCKKTALSEEKKQILNKAFSFIKEDAERQSDNIFKAKALFIKARKIIKEGTFNPDYPDSFS